jgi:hypothetical protein
MVSPMQKKQAVAYVGMTYLICSMADETIS